MSFTRERMNEIIQTIMADRRCQCKNDTDLITREQMNERIGNIMVERCQCINDTDLMTREQINERIQNIMVDMKCKCIKNIDPIKQS